MQVSIDVSSVVVVCVVLQAAGSLGRTGFTSQEEKGGEPPPPQYQLARVSGLHTVPLSGMPGNEAGVEKCSKWKRVSVGWGEEECDDDCLSALSVCKDF